MQQQAKFVNQIKIRIGEPITAIDLNENGLILGSISGYIGYYNINKDSLKYLNETFDELIRDVEIQNDNVAIALVGDIMYLKIDLNDSQLNQISSYSYDHFRHHHYNLCPCTISFINHNHICLFTTLPTQNKDIGNIQETEKFNSYVINFTPSIEHNSQIDRDDSQQEFNKYEKVDSPKYCVPFSFQASNHYHNDHRFLWLEYQEKKIKNLQLFSFDHKKVIYEKRFEKSIYSVAFAKVVGNVILYVQNFKQVKAVNYQTNQIFDLYQHDENISALNYQLVDQSGGQKQNCLDQNMEKVELNIQNMINNLVVCSIDYLSVLCVYQSGQKLKKVDLMKVHNVPQQMTYYKYIFDMGYPYYIQVFNNLIAFTSDFGVFIIQIS